MSATTGPLGVDRQPCPGASRYGGRGGGGCLRSREGRDRRGGIGSAAADLAGGRSGGGAGLSGTTAHSVGFGCPTSARFAMQHPHHVNRSTSAPDDSSLRMLGFAHVPHRVQPFYGALTARKWRCFLNPVPCVGGRVKHPNSAFRKQGQSEKPSKAAVQRWFLPNPPLA